MIRIGIVGCGKIADQHVSEIERISGCEIVGVCDREKLMAKQLFDRFRVKRYFSDVNEFLEEARPDIVHITTSAQSHFEVSKACLNAGCSVFIEKPITLYVEEAEQLINMAIERNLKVTVGHNVQFNHASLRMRDLIKKGYLGGPPVHMESYYCYDLGDPSYARALLHDANHWVRKLPGKLLHNIINHGIAKIAEFLTDYPTVLAYGFASPLLKSVGEKEIIDELRVIIHDDRTTAYFTFSTQINPILHQFRIYGQKNSLIVDDDNQTIIKVKGGKYRSYLNNFIPPLDLAGQYLASSKYNIAKFLKRDFHMNYGMKYLIKSFYDSVVNDTPLPISYRQIILTTRIMQTIFEQIYSSKSNSNVQRDIETNYLDMGVKSAPL